MLFVTLGSQKFQFDRLLKEIDRLSENGDIKDSVFAQIGNSTYIPKNISFKRFLNQHEYVSLLETSDIVISHGGTGAIVSSLKRGKRVIAIPREKNYGEHIDNHQKQIVNEFVKLNLIYGCEKMEDLNRNITNIKKHKFSVFKSSQSNFINELDNYINTI